MTQAKLDCNSTISLQPWEQPFDHELFEKEYLESIENDPERMAEEFLCDDIKTLQSLCPGKGIAYINIISAKQKVRELMEEITKQETIIRVSQKTIQQYKGLEQTEKSNKRGRPARSEYREKIIARFTMKWVASLKDALEVKSCGEKNGLKYMVSSTTEERNWRRWLKGDAIPTYSTFVNLLDSKIATGKYAGEKLCNIPVVPTHNQMSALLQLI